MKVGSCKLEEKDKLKFKLLRLGDRELRTHKFTLIHLTIHLRKSWE